MEKFDNLIKQVILEENDLQFGSFSHLKISSDEFLKALKNAKFFDDSDEDIIFENRKYVCEVPDGLKKLVENVDSFELITKQRILSTIDPNWKYFEKCNKLIDLYVLKFNFSNEDERNIVFKNIIYGDISKIKNKNMFLLKSKNTKGVHIKFDALNFSILILNNESYTKDTINHELTHYFQKTLGIWLYDSKINGILDDFDFSKIEHLYSLNEYNKDTIKLTLSEMLFNEREILTTIDNIIFDVDKLYEDKYKDKFNKNEFKQYFLKSVGTYDKNVLKNEICKNWFNLNLSKKDLYFIILSYILYDGRGIFQEISFNLEFKWIF